MKDIISNYLSKHRFNEFTPKGVLFDMDGVLYNSMPNHAKAWKQCMAQQGLVMSEEDAYKYEGMRGVEAIKIIAGKQWQREITDKEASDIYAIKSSIYSACTPAPIIEGVDCLMQIIKERKWTIGVVTGSGQQSLLNRILNDFNGLVNPEVMVSAKDVEHGKPCPDPYLMGMKKAEINPWETIVVENAPLGVRAAKAAECFTVAINTGPLPDSILEEAGADIVLPNMKSFTELVQKTFPICV